MFVFARLQTGGSPEVEKFGKTVYVFVVGRPREQGRPNIPSY